MEQQLGERIGVINSASLRELSGQQTVIEVMVRYTITKDSF